MSDVLQFSLPSKWSTLTFEAVLCTDPSSREQTYWVYRTDISPRALIATGPPHRLKVTPAYAAWDDEVSLLEQAVMDALRDVNA